MFHVEKMLPEDFKFAVRLSNTMNWDAAEEDFEFITNLEPDGCFVLFYDSKRVGIATTISFEQVGWIGNIIVNEKYRGKGGGSLIVKNAIEYLTNKGVETIGLYSYVNRIPFYERQNFQFDSKFMVIKGIGFSTSIKAHIRTANENDMQQIFDLDKQCFGGSRKKLLEPVLHDSSSLCYVCADDDRILGFTIAKVSDETSEIGPLVCSKGYDEVAIDLIKTVLGKLGGYEVSLCVPEKESVIINLLKQQGFKEDFSLARMFRGPPVTTNFIYVAESSERG
jgi:ribosomal protein S18 acetylase RimI-like enzyme